MQHLLTTLQKADAQRLARAAVGLADESILVNIIHQDETEARALVTNGDGKDYTVAISEHDTFCSCKDWIYRKDKINGVCKHIVSLTLAAIRCPEAGTAVEHCLGCETILDADQGLRTEDGNNGAVVEAGPFCEPCGLAKLEEAKSALESVEATSQSGTSAVA